MKILIAVLAVAATCMISNSHAQEDRNLRGSYDWQEDRGDFRTNMYFGIKIGSNFSNVYDSKIEEFNAKSKFGLATGFFINIPFGKYLGLQPEILFSQKGFRASGTIFDTSYEMKRTTNYLDIPLLLQLKPGKDVILLAGLQYSYLLSQEDVYLYASSGMGQEKEFGSVNIHRNKMGFLTGIDFNINALVLGVRVGWDLYNIKKDWSFSTPQHKNIWFQATLGYRFY